MSEPVNIMDRVDETHRKVLRAIPDGFLDLSDIAAARVRFDEVQAKLAVALPDDVRIEDRRVPGPPGDPDVTVRLYRPDALASGRPAFYWIHGGGMILGRVADSDGKCAKLASRLGMLVASVEYRLAPEHPFPAPLEDCYAGLKWFSESGDELGIDRSRVAIGGASAGGGLAAGLALLARDRGEVDVCFQLLIYPMLDDRNESHSSRVITDPKVWNRQANLDGWNAYLAGNAGGADVSSYAAPARAADLSGLPPAYLNVGDLDLFLDEDVAYANALTAAGVPCELHVYPGAVHGSDILVSRSTLSRRWIADERAALQRALFPEAP